VQSAAKPQPGQCLSTDQFATPGINTRTGTCVDLTQYRVVNFLEGKANGYQPNIASYNAFAAQRGFRINVDSFAAYPMVANFKHDDKFWVAQLNLRNVSAAYFQVEEFKISLPKERLQNDPQLRGLFEQAIAAVEKMGPNLQPQSLKTEVENSIKKARDTGEYFSAHGQIRLDFSAPVPLALHNDSSIRTQVSSVILSVHAIAEKYDPAEGLKGVYPLALGVFSGKQKFADSVLKQNNNFRQYKINLANEDLLQFVALYLRQSEQLYRERDYNTFSANCGNIPFEIIEQSFFGRKFPGILAVAQKNQAASFGRAYPKYAQYALQAYRLLQNQNDLRGEAWTTPPP
jgi:hypothetical protein